MNNSCVHRDVLCLLLMFGHVVDAYSIDLILGRHRRVSPGNDVFRPHPGRLSCILCSVPDTRTSSEYPGLAIQQRRQKCPPLVSISSFRCAASVDPAANTYPPPCRLAYLTFDFLFVLVASAAITIIFQAISDIWYHIGYFFVVLMLYGLASTALAYVISLMVRSQLAAFAFAAAGQA